VTWAVKSIARFAVRRFELPLLASGAEAIVRPGEVHFAMNYLLAGFGPGRDDFRDAWRAADPALGR
jgi:hypothetical protein